jgi:protein-tyrosine phosphatase
MEESVAMLRMAAEAGTTDIVATPHANLEFTFQPEAVGVKIAELTAASGGAPRIHSGCDFHLYYDNIQDALANPRKYTVNHRNYLLVEFSDLLIFKSTEEIFDRLFAAGMTPVVTHPERNPLLQQRIDRLAAWREHGCLMQVTAQSLLGGFGRAAGDFADQMIRRGLVDVVASDAHDSRHRPPALDEAYAAVSGRYGEDLAERLFVINPRAVIDGAPMPSMPSVEPRAPRKWYQFW